MKDIKKVVAQLQKEGAERVNNVVVKNVTIKDINDFTRVILTLNKEVPQMVKQDNGDYVEGTHSVVFASVYSIGAVLSNNEDIAFAKNLIMTSPELLTMILSYAEIDVVLEHVPKDTEYINPFSSKTEGKPVAHDSIYTHVIDIRLGKKGAKIVEMLESKMLDAMIAGTFSKVAAGVDAKDED